MGFWSEIGKFLSKQSERVMLIASGVQWGDSRNDAEKITSSLMEYNNRMRWNEQSEAKSDSVTIMYILLVLIFLFVIFIVLLCFKTFIDNLKKGNNHSQNIALTTLREGNRSASSPSNVV